MRGYEVYAGDNFYFARDAAAALRFAEFWASVGHDALFYEAVGFDDLTCKRSRRISYENMRERVYNDEWVRDDISERSG